MGGDRHERTDGLGTLDSGVPAISRARTPCLAQLASELGYASKPTLLRHLGRIDGLAPQIDPDNVYPQDWIVFRITGYRPDIAAPELVPGGALRADLSALAESISESARLTLGDLPEPFETIDSLARRWSVSRKTIERYRRLGLIARRIDKGGGRRAVVFLRSAVEWFEALNADRLGRAARFDRFSERELARIERMARRYRARLGWSRSQTAARIAQRTGHSHEGVRKALGRLNAEASRPIFTEPGPASWRDQMLAYRATLRGIEPSVIAKRTGRTPPTVRRAIRVARYQLLRSCGLPETAPDLGALDEVLNAQPVMRAPWLVGLTDLSELIGSMRVREVAVAYEERTRAVARALLVGRAGWLLGQLDPTSPSGAALDRIETDLRHASKLKALLVSAQLPLLLSTIEHRLGGPIDTIAPGRAAHLIIGAITVASGAIDRYDPMHGGRIAAPVGLAVTRFASRQPDVAQPITSGKAMRRIPPGHAVDDWCGHLDPWRRWLAPDRRLLGVLGAMDAQDRELLVRRFGLNERPPCTRAGLCEGMADGPVEGLGRTVTQIARRERRALRRAGVLWRAGG